MFGFRPDWRKSLGKLDNPEIGLSLLGSMLDAKENQTIFVIGDSTGNDTDEWVYLLGQKIATKFPGYNVKYTKYDDASGRYEAFSDIANVGEERHLRCDPSYGTYLYQLNPADIPLTSPDLDARIKVSLDDWTPGAQRTIFGRYTSAGYRSWKLMISSSNQLNYNWSDDGTNNVTKGYSVNTNQFTDGQAYWLRVTHDVDDGAGNNVVKLYKSDDGITWTELQTITTEGVTTIFDAQTAYNIGGYSYDGEKITGKIYDVEIRDGIDGDVISPKPIDAWKPYPSNTSHAGAFEGYPTVYIYNGSIPGYNINHFNDLTRIRKMIFNSVCPLVFCSVSHNDADSRGADYLAKWETLVNAIKAYCINPNIVMLTQNPEISPASYISSHAMRRRLLLGYARQNNLGIVDTYLAFLQDGRPLSDLIKADGLHPQPAGSQVWADAVWKYLNII